MVLLKTLLAPVLIGIATGVSRRWGPAAGGLFAALPLTSGPVVLIFAIERGAAFAARVCGGILLGLIPLTAFTLAYAWSARWLAWPWCTVLGCAAYLVCAWWLAQVSASLFEAFVVGCALLVLGLRMMPRAGVNRRGPISSSWDIPVRMALAAVMVFGITSAAGTFGPRVSGLLTPFPVAATLLVAFTHRFEGEAAAVRLLRGLLIGLFSFAFFFLVVGLSVTRSGTAAAFGAATLGAVVIQGIVWRFLSL